ncbi:uncharacterized protein LOC110460756 [Mizuhopecten yessoensis]|uniref:uncharacterized protein LOC110460756 n=1 Tax=Mizuhopecten yessoensis TaxID=6573 RepID=UPI000B45D303|nr:uncharacterized protein LOC110460756 [Mizuhopecten yessoensis]
MHAFQDHLNHSFTCEFVEISAENNILVSHFVVRTEWLNAGMYYPVPLQHYTSKYVVPVAPFYMDCQLSLVARDGEQNNILVQDTVIPAQWTSIPSSPYVVTTVTVTNTEVLRVTDISGATFGGHLTCFNPHTTAATVLLPKDISFTANLVLNLFSAAFVLSDDHANKSYLF